MSGQPPQLRDQAGISPGLRIGGAIVLGIGLIFAISGFASFFSAFGSASPPKHFWMAFVGATGGALVTLGYAHWRGGRAQYGELGLSGVVGLIAVAAASSAIAYWKVRGYA